MADEEAAEFGDIVADRVAGVPEEQADAFFSERHHFVPGQLDGEEHIGGDGDGGGLVDSAGAIYDGEMIPVEDERGFRKKDGAEEDALDTAVVEGGGDVLGRSVVPRKMDFEFVS